jgi:geranylgeranyl diphosphate synthase, type II
MDSTHRIAGALQASISRAVGPGCPPQLAAALQYAVFPSGALVRPRLSLAVAYACGDSAPDIADAAAASIELLHCGSLVHDDLPCFDDADTRRGKPSVHRAFGQPLAVLVGDALIVSAFQTLARHVLAAPERVSALIALIGGSVAAPSGIIAGQAWECEPTVPLEAYHAAKTGSLFAAATTAGATAAGYDAAPWRRLGECLGEAYQLADDICDCMADPATRGKPGGRDKYLGRPNAVEELGLPGAMQRLKSLLSEAPESVPQCPRMDELRAHIAIQAQPYLPKEVSRIAA